MILFVSRIPPALDGHGGSQRAWFQIQAMRQIDRVHFVLISRQSDRDAASVSLDPIRPMVDSVTHIDIPSWEPLVLPHLGPIHRDWAQVWRMRSQDAPRFSGASLRRIADQLPVRECDVLVAGRLPTAVILQDMIDHGLLRARFRVADVDDLMSRFVERRLALEGATGGRQGRALLRLDARYLRRSEVSIASSWDAVSLCTEEDIAFLRQLAPRSKPFRMPGVLSRDLLPPRAEDGTFRILFVGNLSFKPNIQGLRHFVDEAWPAIKSALPEARLVVVGMLPGAEVEQIVAEHGAELHANVPEMAPYYENCDLVISPILLGSGMRIKIVEALAYGRPVVSTEFGAAGLGIMSGQEAILVDTVAEFADAVIGLARDPARRRTLVAQARAFQEREYGPPMMETALRTAMAPALATA